jgi:hypothetical protein
MIPKIIHQIGPKFRSKWHPAWKVCHDTWLRKFEDFEIKIWNDSDDLDSFIEEKYPERYEFYKNLPYHMIKMDFSRYAILNYYGGIYADLDMYCYENFYEILDNQVCLIEPIDFDNNEGDMIMGCLMASKPDHLFWQECMNRSEEVYNSIDKEKLSNYLNVFDSFSEILEIGGPKLIFNVYTNFSNKEQVQLLSKDYFHPDVGTYFDGMKTKHMKTMVWGEESMQLFESGFKNLNLNYEDGMKNLYQHIRGVDLDNYEYDKNYYES